LSLDQLIVVKDSTVHGKGVFCRIPIPEGTYIGTYESEPSEIDGTYVLWIHEERGEETGWDGTNDLRFLNHSYEPNAELDGLDLYSLRDLVPGEEIYIHYQWDPRNNRNVRTGYRAAVALRSYPLALKVSRGLSSHVQDTAANSRRVVTLRPCPNHLQPSLLCVDGSGHTSTPACGGVQHV